MGAFLDEDTDHRHVDYFQSLEKFREQGLPGELPARVEEALKNDPGFVELESEIQALKHKKAPVPHLTRQSADRPAISKP
jgi:hypothetical protein